MALREKTTQRNLEKDTQLQNPIGKFDETIVEFVERLESALKFDKNCLDDALEEQSGIFHEIADELAIQISRRDQAKKHVTDLESETVVEIKTAAREKDQKITDKEVEAQTQLDEGVIKASKTLAELSLIVGRLSALKESYVQRSYALKDLVALQINQYGVESASNIEGAKGALNEARYQRVKNNDKKFREERRK